jgi:two-component system, chemotaxis family, protein-glutamate methylesterase/glutaminase
MHLRTPEPDGMERCLRIRVLAVDDSAVMRSLLRTALGTCPQIEIVGTAQDGRAALEPIERLAPDLVLLDVEMPCMSGLEVLAEIRARRLRVKVIICSTLTRRGASITLEALARGAADYVSKPLAQDAADSIAALRRELLPKIFALFPPEGWQCPVEFPYRSLLVSAYPDLRAASIPGVLVIGVSTGGPAALEQILPALPADFPLPVLIAQHMPRLFTSLLAERLDGLCPFSVREAEAGAQISRGNAYLARGDWHLEVAGTSARSSLRLHQGDSADRCRPSVDLLFRSAAAVYGAGVLALVLTGMGSDGLDGCRAVSAEGGRILVQDRPTSAVWGMPGAVAREGLADRVLPLVSIAGEITRFARHGFERQEGKPELSWQLGW